MGLATDGRMKPQRTLRKLPTFYRELQVCERCIYNLYRGRYTVYTVYIDRLIERECVCVGVACAISTCAFTAPCTYQHVRCVYLRLAGACAGHDAYIHIPHTPSPSLLLVLLFVWSRFLLHVLLLLSLSLAFLCLLEPGSWGFLGLSSTGPAPFPSVTPYYHHTCTLWGHPPVSVSCTIFTMLAGFSTVRAGARVKHAAAIFTTATLPLLTAVALTWWG